MVEMTWPNQPCTLNYPAEIIKLQDELQNSGLLTQFRWYRSEHRENYEIVRDWLNDIMAGTLTAGFACSFCHEQHGIQACVHRLPLTWMNNVEFYAFLMLSDNEDDDDDDDEEEEKTEDEKNGHVLRMLMCLLAVQFYQRLATEWRHEQNEDGTHTWRLDTSAGC